MKRRPFHQQQQTSRIPENSLSYLCIKFCICKSLLKTCNGPRSCYYINNVTQTYRQWNNNVNKYSRLSCVSVKIIQHMVTIFGAQTNVTYCKNKSKFCENRSIFTWFIVQTNIQTYRQILNSHMAKILTLVPKLKGDLSNKQKFKNRGIFSIVIVSMIST